MELQNSNSTWFTESAPEIGTAFSLATSNLLHQEKSAYQNIFPPQGGNHGIRTGVTKQKQARQAPFGVIKFRGKEQLSYHSKNIRI